MKPFAASTAAERALAETYDATPYAGLPYCHTHPSLLAALGTLYGLKPADPAGCRVLEMGCGDGSNLVPMADEFPESTFTGIDLSPVQIGIGRKFIDSLGLSNLRLETRSIMDVGPEDGRYDYIICHGVYSWVPDAVKARILDICRENLAAQGIAYISYNVLPGWQFNRTMREMIRFRTRHIETVEERVRAALDLMQTMLEATKDGKGVHDVQLRFFAKTLQDFNDMTSYLVHEYMEADNDPCYFHEFARELKNHGLQYVCDAEQSSFELDGLPADAATTFEAIAQDGSDIEQYIDFLKNTRFRRSLICQADADIHSEYRLDRLDRLFAATEVTPILEGPEQTVKSATAFRTTSDRRFSTTNAAALSILRTLCAIKPCTISVPELIRDAKAAFSSDGARTLSTDVAEKIGHVVYTLFFDGVLELAAADRRCVPAVGKRPTASPVARLMAPTRRVTNRCHRTVVMDDDMACFVLAHLDGSRDREALLSLMREALRSGRVPLPETVAGNTDADIRELTRNQLTSILQHLPRCGLMVA